jgi:hypothetical protein
MKLYKYLLFGESKQFSSPLTEDTQPEVQPIRGAVASDAVKDIVATLTELRGHLDANKMKYLQGNCGNFTVALITFFTDKYPQLKSDFGIAMTSNAQTLEDLYSGEFDVYHVYMVFDGYWYDIYGLNSEDAIDKFAKKEYSDPDPQWFQFKYKNAVSDKMLSFLRWNTAWSTPVGSMYWEIHEANNKVSGI